MSFKATNDAYEAWLKTQCAVVEKDLKDKHKKMRESAFVFLRATFFRWAKKIEDYCPDLSKAPAVLSVGDIHIENFGTWRDADGRLVWGVNDFDEAAEIPYPFDLMRLAVSAVLASRKLLDHSEIAAALLAGYTAGLKTPRPTLLEETALWMRPYVVCGEADCLKFWDRIEKADPAAPPPPVMEGFREDLPPGVGASNYGVWAKGTGSLGRPRYFAVADWRGGRVVRDAKAVVPSAWLWAHKLPFGAPAGLALANGLYRAPDPTLKIKDQFLYRRAAPDARKLELADDQPFSKQSLTAMGFDLGAIHAADPRRAAVIAHLEQSPSSWLTRAMETAAAKVEEDYHEWKALKD